MEKYDEAIASHKAKVEHYRREMEKIKLHPVDDNPTPELKQLSEDELAEMRVDSIQNMLNKSEIELAKMSPNLQVTSRSRSLRWFFLN
jgi:structural maintenance of chromosome 4